MIRRSQTDWITEAGLFFQKKGPVWETLRMLHKRLDQAAIDYLVIGGLALSAHNYPRQTVNVDVVLEPSGFDAFKHQYGTGPYDVASGAPRRFVDRASEVTIDVLIAGELAGRRSRNSSIRFPQPRSAQIVGELRTVSLSQLIELKLVTWRFKDWGDVVELIRRNHLRAEFSATLDPIVRSAYGECYDQAHDSDYEEPQG